MNTFWIIYLCLSLVMGAIIFVMFKGTDKNTNVGDNILSYLVFVIGWPVTVFFMIRNYLSNL